MKTKTNLILKTMNVMFWIIFIGLCIKTGAIMISFYVSLFVNPKGAKNLYLGLNLNDLYNFDILHYVVTVSLLIIISGMKAFLAYLVIRIFLKFNLAEPFNTSLTLLISKISHCALAIGIIALIANLYCEWLIKNGVNIQQNWGSAEFLFLSGIIFILAQVFKKGVEFQTENELTI